MSEAAEAPQEEKTPAPKRSRARRGAPSGRLLLRMPPELHAEVAQAAEREQVSLNQFITTAVAGAVGWNGASPVQASDDERSRPTARLLNLAIAANLVIVTVAGAVAIALLVIAWRAGW
jgi:hypothetical protein